MFATLPDQPARAAGKEKVLKALPAGKDAVQLQLVCGGCAKGKDCLSVRAVGAGAPAAPLVLRDDSVCRGGNDVSVDFAMREIKLSPALTGALVKEEAGHEAIAHSHWLVALVDGKVTKLWEATYSTQEVVPIDSYRLKVADTDGNGRQEIDYVAPFPTSNNLDLLAAGEAGADTWSRQVLEFSDEKKAMVEKPAPAEYAAVLASTKSLPDALKLKMTLLKTPKCDARDFLVLETEAFPKLRNGLYVVASIVDSRAAAQARLQHIKGCRPEISGAVRQAR